jgi:hypothetical protein
MASGSYAKKPIPREPAQNQREIPRRATKQLEEVAVEEGELETGPLQIRLSRALQLHSAQKVTMPVHFTRVVDEFRPHPLERHKPWLKRVIICMVAIVIGLLILLSSAISQRPSTVSYISFFGGKVYKVYNVQVGGDLAGSWQRNGPQPTKVAIPSHPGPYSVLGQPTITADFINQVLAAYHSPAAGKGQTLYDLGVKYGIDPAFALAFFMHESTFGTAGEARSSLSLGNLRCIPNFKCQDNYAWFNTWEDGFVAWYELIRNLYVAVWGLTSVDQIVPRYAPSSDNNNEAAYIAAVKHAVDTWRSGQIYVS